MFHHGKMCKHNIKFKRWMDIHGMVLFIYAFKDEKAIVYIFIAHVINLHKLA